MSSHVIDLSGQRQLQLTLNDPAVSRLWAPAKAGDDVEFSFGNGREIRVALHPNARIQYRRVTVQKQRVENGRLVEGDGPGGYAYDDFVEWRRVLVVTGSLSGFIRASLTPDERALEDGAEGKPTHENQPHTSVVARRKGNEDWHYLEAGDLAEEIEVGSIPSDAALTTVRAALTASLTVFESLGIKGDRAVAKATALCYDALAAIPTE